MSTSGALGVALQGACKARPGATAAQDATGAVTYAQLIDFAQHVSQCLHKAGLQPDEPVHVLVANRTADLAALIGIWLAGGVAVPVHRSTPTAVAQAFHRQTKARFQIEGRWDDQDADGASMLTRLAANAPPLRLLLQDAALVVFTSGSTGEPKGVVIGHRAFSSKIEQIDLLLQFGASESTLLVLNITFSFGLWVGLLTLLRGGRLVMQPKFDVSMFVDALQSERITRVGMVPTMMRLLFASTRQHDSIAQVAQNGSLRQILVGGESLGATLAATIRKTFAKTDLIDIYGLTETATCDFFAFPADYAAAPGSIGRPASNVRFRIVDAAGQTTPPGGVGELQLQSPHLMAGYLDRPELTAAAYQDGWFKTGDLARVLDAGYVELMGRQKELIGRGGNKVTPVEIEQAATTHGDVAAAMAVGIDDALLGQRIALLLVPRAGVALDIGAVQAHLRDRLERFKQPDVWFVQSDLPLGRTGKADRAQFKALIDAGVIDPIKSPLAANPP
ncbi:MAG: long-chain fatty acid--CoA ligase [Burkholderiales bacterium]